MTDIPEYACSLEYFKIGLKHKLSNILSKPPEYNGIEVLTAIAPAPKASLQIIALFLIFLALSLPFFSFLLNEGVGSYTSYFSRSLTIFSLCLMSLCVVFFLTGKLFNRLLNWMKNTCKLGYLVKYQLSTHNII